MPPAGTAAPPRSRGLMPGQGRLLGGSLLIVLGAFLPWVLTGAGAVSGMRGPGLWTFYVAMLGLAGALVPRRRLAAGQGMVVAAVSLGLVGWQVVHLLNLVGTAGWSAGPGMALTVGGGVLAAVAARRLLQEPSQPS